MASPWPPPPPPPRRGGAPPPPPPGGKPPPIHIPGTGLAPWLISLVIFLAAGAAGAVMPPDWRVQGQGEMRWFGLRLYEASLWAPGGRWQAELPYALELRYARDIPSGRLVDASIQEMQRLGAADDERLARWKVALEQVFPDVRSGDVIVGMHLPARGAEFYHQGRLTGRIDDVDFARAFFAIWLDERTREPGLRARLLGRT
ncbi:MAG: chalcone isomerase family protein [Sulfuritalea sp.]|nr:chalcone isomerase family protein [Sulfuritalea sp.]